MLHPARLLSKFLHAMTIPRVIVLSAVIMVVLVALDWLAGPDISLTVFYLVPVGMIVWFAGTRAGLVALLVSMSLWFFLDYQEERSLRALRLYWEVLTPIPMFLLFIWLVRMCRRLIAEVATLVQARTEILQAELAARKSAEEARQTLVIQVTAAEEAERRRLALDMHDTLGQEMTALKMTLRRVEVALPESAERTAILGASHALEKLIEQTRNMSFDLYPATLDDLGLVATLEQFAAQYAARTAVAVSVSVNGSAHPLTFEHSTMLYRAVKELICNAAKHGPATHVQVRIHWRTDALRIVVDDDGRGLATSNTSAGQTGLGLRWIRDRLSAFGGELLLESTPGSGARAILTLPASELAPVPQEVLA